MSHFSDAAESTLSSVNALKLDWQTPVTSPIIATSPTRTAGTYRFTPWMPWPRHRACESCKSRKLKCSRIVTGTCDRFTVASRASPETSDVSTPAENDGNACRELSIATDNEVVIPPSAPHSPAPPIEASAISSSSSNTPCIDASLSTDDSEGSQIAIGPARRQDRHESADWLDPALRSLPLGSRIVWDDTSQTVRLNVSDVSSISLAEIGSLFYGFAENVHSKLCEGGGLSSCGLGIAGTKSPRDLYSHACRTQASARCP